MKRSRYTEEQIIGILKEQEAGVPVAELCRKHGMSDATFYNWKSKYGGLEVSEARRLRSLEAENAKLKRLLAASREVTGTDGRPATFLPRVVQATGDSIGGSIGGGVPAPSAYRESWWRSRSLRQRAVIKHILPPLAHRLCLGHCCVVFSEHR